MMAQVNGDGEVEHGNQLVISPGQCITLTFSGIISFGHNGGAIVPSTANGQTYTLHVIASNNAEMKLNCTLPLSANSCTVVSNNNGNKED
ncbi:MAG: hypothetical protein JRN52_11700 [Nitrososphaerota archaeon]|nr:hypothetical protein [Nitrososphaerota archaeon]